MHNPHRQLVSLFQEKEQADPTQIYSVQDAIKVVADRLSQESKADDHLDAAFAYYVAGYYVRASRLISELDISQETHPAQRWLALILVKRFEFIEVQVRAIEADDKYSDETLQQEILHGGLSDLEALDRIFIRKLAETLGQFLCFVHSGDQENFNRSQSTLVSCQRLACKAQEWRWWWWLECTRLVIDEFSDNCLWTQLGPMRQESGADQVVSRYIISNYKRSNPVVQLWRTQVESLDRINDPDRCSFCLAVPTGAGKTRVAELAILRFFLDYPHDTDAKCVYIAPLRRLASEVEKTLESTFAAVTRNRRVVSKFYGGREVDILDQEELNSSRVLIVTPEKLDGMLRHDPRLLSQIRLVIADEGHMIGERHTPGDTIYRSYRYRMLLERLVYALRIKHVSTETDRARLLFISGVLPNVEEFAELITGDRSKNVSLRWSPTEEPIKGTWTWDGRKLIASANVPEPRILSPLTECRSTNEFEQAVAYAAFTCAASSPTLVFSASKKAITGSTLLNLLECLVCLSPLEDPLPAELPRRRRFRKYYTLLERGVAIHHAGLPPELKEETEKRIYNHRVRLLFASPTLAQGVNIPFDTLLVYRLQYWHGAPIQDATFWNVAGRVGRPLPHRDKGSGDLSPPQVVFVHNRSPTATSVDKVEFKIWNQLLSREKQYRVESPFLGFLNELRQQWAQSTGQPVASLVENLAERPDLQWLEYSDQEKEWRRLLRLLDEHLTALIEESCPYTQEASDWLQVHSIELINLLVQATTIETDDLEFIKEAVLARARFIAQKIPRLQRRQDYLLGLPLRDCETIRTFQNTLSTWYRGCEDIFARKFDPGIDMLVQLLNFVSNLSICGKWRSRQTKPLPMFEMFGLDVPDTSTRRRCALFRSWILGEEPDMVAANLKEVHPDAELEEYREEMFESWLAWGMSAVCRFLGDIAQTEGLRLTKDLEYLPALVKYGVPGNLECYLVRLNLPREIAVRVAELHIVKTKAAGSTGLTFAQPMMTVAQEAIMSLSEDDIAPLDLGDAVLQRIREMKGLKDGVS